jgi:hypothetical protein
MYAHARLCVCVCSSASKSLNSLSIDSEYDDEEEEEEAKWVFEQKKTIFSSVSHTQSSSFSTTMHTTQ